LEVPDSSGYGDKRGRNKPIGPGGSTRRLHQMPPPAGESEGLACEIQVAATPRRHLMGAN